jgi:transaldolase/glucose-6-phosphate isomerase
MRTPTPDQSRPANRVLSKDASYWSDDADVQTKILNRLGWLDAIETSRDQQGDVRAFVRDVRQRNFRNVLLLGMGGSSLAPEVFARFAGQQPGSPTLIMLDTTNPEQILATRAQIDPRDTLVIVSSKSGETLETVSLYRYFLEEYSVAALESPASHFVAITDEGSALHQEAQNREFLKCFLNDPAVGGRYSALSLFGLVPAAVLGVDVYEVLAAAARARDACIHGDGEGVKLGEWLAAGWQAGRNKLALVIPDEFQALGWWIEQLIAESLGKDGKGFLPYLEVDSDRAIRADTLYVDWTSKDPGDEEPGFIRSLQIPTVGDLGALFFNWEFGTAVAGGLLGVNPFDEPDVADTKGNTAVYLGGNNVYDSLSAIASPSGVRTFLGDVRDGDYVAILAYLAQGTVATSESLEGLKRGIERLTGVPVTLAPGPRYLHSVGQYHKGGPDSGLFLIVVSHTHPVLPVPGESYDFGTLISAQALGDYKALKGKGRRVMMITEADIPLLE